MTNNRAPASPAQARHPYSPVYGTGTGLFFVSGQLGGSCRAASPRRPSRPWPEPWTARTCVAVAELPYRARPELDAIAARTGT